MTDTSPETVSSLLARVAELEGALRACEPFMRRAAEAGETADDAYAALRSALIGEE